MTPAERIFKSHGTENSYRRGCRCAECRRANAAQQARRRVARKKQLDDASFEHGRSGYCNWGCRCAICTKAWSEATLHSTRLYQEAHREEVNRRTDARRRPIQAQSVEKAARNGFAWTGPELELIARQDLTAEQAAAMLGRTFWAVTAMRGRLAKEPKFINLAGLSRETQASLGNPRTALGDGSIGS